MYPQAKNIHPRILVLPQAVASVSVQAPTASKDKRTPPDSVLAAPPVHICKGYDRFYKTEHRWHKSATYKEKDSGRVYRCMRCAKYLDEMQCAARGVKFENKDMVTVTNPHHEYCIFNVDEAHQRTALAKESACSSDDPYRTFLNVGSRKAEELLEIARKSSLEEIKESIIRLYPRHIRDLLTICGFKLAKLDQQ
ncbi:uncharacterized protein LOC117176818 [Belonocnema kinseyi]|uniref:uncharacterized protein LOC117176818 n=1 Tax=Belonocnema kinseyi TaxID=2817044 RepID=UPI00143CE58D|nr:uncharacterized protein LOC117176818 [Belonocnema kinseyi]